MQTLSVSEYGIHYMQMCFQYYTENCGYFVFYVAALIYIALKGTKEEKRIFLPNAIFLLATVFNPLFPVVINKIFDINKEYYRFFWIPPVVILTSYVAAKIVESQKSTKKIFTLISIIFMFAITGNFVYKNQYIPAQNIYKMPTEIPEISKIIHDDTTEEYPRAIFEYDFHMLIRQYDPTILLAADREAYLNAVGGQLSMTEVLADENYYNRLLAVVALNIEINKEEFLKGLDKTNTEYVVVSTQNPITEYLESNGLQLVATTENHSIYRYQLKEPVVFELPDYSDVWANY
ncbi:MAG: hypothetical protein PHY47_01455 [Lachnospiraceae bacterium]|nr:hypothetical protein [Lachnospiraceae bacterium]